MIFFDTETCGLVGPTILIQYSDTNAPSNKVILHDVWSTPVRDTLSLVERICDNDVCAFNLSFDWFHLTQLYNTFLALPDASRPPVISQVAKEYTLRKKLWCLKPKSALDLFLFTRKTEWQCLMHRHPIRIKRIPTEVAVRLVDLLQEQIKFSDIFFSRRRDGYQWQVTECNKNPQPNLRDVVLVFGASGGLKPLCEEIFKTKTFERGIPDDMNPIEYSYNPYDTSWQAFLPYHIKHWELDKNARHYAEQDVILLQRLYDHFGQPPPGDVDSELACCVGAARWRGYSVDLRAIENRIQQQRSVAASASTAPNAAKEYLRAVATPAEQLAITGTDKKLLESLDEWGPDNAVAQRAAEIINARKADKELDILSKLKETKRFCPDFKVIGAKSGRMSGGSDLGVTGGSLNPQGIQRQPAFRRLFTLADEKYTLSGGDFSSFEVTIADAAYRDPTLRHDLQTGRSLHGIFGAILYDESYDEIMSSKGTDTNLYNPAKNSLFAYLYGAHAERVAKTAGVPEESAESALQYITERYPNVRLSRERIFDAFCSMRQPGGIGTEVIWKDPADYVETLLGFRRYFTLENSVVRTLFKLAQNPPKCFEMFGRVTRTTREQTIKGAVMSALYAICFNIQAQNMRAAANHVIQGTGAYVCKDLQNSIWQIQPSGIHEWVVQPFNVHDEVMVVHTPEIGPTVTSVVNECIKRNQETIPLLAIDWKENLNDWSGK